MEDDEDISVGGRHKIIIIIFCSGIKSELKGTTNFYVLLAWRLGGKIRRKRES